MKIIRHIAAPSGDTRSVFHR